MHEKSGERYAKARGNLQHFEGKFVLFVLFEFQIFSCNYPFIQGFLNQVINCSNILSKKLSLIFNFEPAPVPGKDIKLFFPCTN